VNPTRAEQGTARNPRMIAGMNLPQLIMLCLATGALAALLTAVVSNIVSPVVALLTAVGLAAATAMVWSPAIAIQVLVFSIPFERIGRLTDDADSVAVSVSRILGVITLCSLLLHAFIRKQPLRLGWPFYLYGGYTAIALLSNAWAYTPEETFKQGFAILGNLLFLFLILNLVRDFATMKRAVIVWLLATILAAGFSLGDYYVGFTAQVADAEMGLQSNRLSSTVSDGGESRSIGANVRRLFGTTGHPTLFGLNNTMAVPFFLWIMRFSRGPINLLWFGGLLMSVYALVLSNTRAILLVFAVVAVYALVRRLWTPSLKAVVALVVVGLAVVPFIPEDVYMRVLDPAMYTTDKGDSLRVRFKFWEKSFDIIQETWLHGLGAGNQSALIERITDEATGYMTPLGLRASAHNEYIWVLAEVGIFGYLFFWSFVGRVTWTAFRAGAVFRQLGAEEERFLMVATQAVMVIVLIFAGQSETFHYPLKAWWLLAGMSGNLLYEARSRMAQTAALDAPE
jgi:O-antigen ligase